MNILDRIQFLYYKITNRGRQKLDWKTRTLSAEWDAPHGRLGGIVIQLRQRGKNASTRAFWMLVTLVFTVAIGLAYYVVRPLLQDFSDGRRFIYKEQLNESTIENTELNKRRDNLAFQLSTALQPSVSPIITNVSENFLNLTQIKGTNTLLAVSESGTIYRSTDFGKLWKIAQYTQPRSSSFLYNVPGTDLILTGEASSEQNRYWSTDDGKNWNTYPINSAKKAYKFMRKDQENDVIFAFGDDNEISKSENNGVTWRRFSTGEGNTRIYSLIIVPNTNILLALNSEGRVIKSKNSGEDWYETTFLHTVTKNIVFDRIYSFPDHKYIYATELNEKKSISFYRMASTSDGWAKIGAIERGDIVGISSILGTNILHTESKSGDFYWSQNNGETWTKSFDGHDGEIRSVIKIPETNILISVTTDGRILRSENNGIKWSLLSSPLSSDLGYLNYLTRERKRILIGTGFRGTIFRSEDDGIKWNSHKAGREEFFREVVAIKGTNLVAAKSKNSIIWSADNGESWAPIPGASVAEAAKENTLFTKEGSREIITLNNGRISKISNDLAMKFSEEVFPKGTSGDSKLDELFGELPENVRNDNLLSFFNADYEGLKRNRSSADKKSEKAASALESLGSGAYSVEQKQKSFSEFMFSCREPKNANGGVTKHEDGAESENKNGVSFADKDGSITKACADAFVTFLPNGNKSWWITVAEEVPRGILLLFLLATLATLYRYNLRLAAFHNSRADALELVSIRQDFKELEKYAGALAADRVEFGKTNTPADQAVEVAKAFANKV